MTEDRDRYVGKDEPANDDDAHPVVRWVRGQLARDRKTLAALKAGTFGMWEMHEGERVDLTADMIKQTETSIAELEELLRGWGNAAT